MELSTTTQDEKKKVSMLALSALCVPAEQPQLAWFQVDEEHIAVYSSVIGDLFIIPAQSSCGLYVRSSHLTITDEMMRLIQSTVMPTAEEGSIKGDKPYVESIANKSLLVRQTEVFIGLIEEAVQSTIRAASKQEDSSALVSGDFKELIPSLHALHQCIKSGWKPDSLPQSVISVAVQLLNNTECDNDESNASGGVTGFLIDSLQVEGVGEQVLNSLLIIMQKHGWCTGRSFFNVLDQGLSQLISCTYIGTIWKAFLAKQFLQRQEQLISTRLGSSSDQIERNARRQLQLGDSVEILISSRSSWITGSIVKINALTDELFVEYMQNDAKIVHESGALTDSNDGDGTSLTAVHRFSEKLRIPRLRERWTGGSIQNTENIRERCNEGNSQEAAVSSATFAPVSSPGESESLLRLINCTLYLIMGALNFDQVDESGHHDSVKLENDVLGEDFATFDDENTRMWNENSGMEDGNTVGDNNNNVSGFNFSNSDTLSTGQRNTEYPFPHCNQGHRCQLISCMSPRVCVECGFFGGMHTVSQSAIASTNEAGIQSDAVAPDVERRLLDRSLAMEGTYINANRIVTQYIDDDAVSDNQNKHGIEVQCRQPKYIWCCRKCHFYLCTQCYPVSDAFASNFRTFGDWHRMFGQRTSQPSKFRRGGKLTVCLIGRSDTSFCTVFTKPDVHSLEVARLPHGSVIDVFDLIRSDFYEISSGAGFVRKLSGGAWRWKLLVRGDRYAGYAGVDNDEDDAAAMGREDDDFAESCFRTVESTPRQYPHPNGDRTEDKVEESPLQIFESPSALSVSTKTISTAFMLAELIRSLMERDRLKKTVFISGEMFKKSVALQNSERHLFETATKLFSKTALEASPDEHLDIFEDESDDFNVSLAELESSDALVSVIRTLLNSTSGSAITVSIPPVAGRCHVEARAVLREHFTDSHERVALLTFGWLFDTIIDVVTIYIEQQIQNAEQRQTSEKVVPPLMSPVVAAALDVVGIITLSEFKSVLVPFFYRPLIAKAGLRAQLVACTATNRELSLRESTCEMLAAFSNLEQVENAYMDILCHSRLQQLLPFKMGLKGKLKDTIVAVGYTPLAKGIIERSCKKSMHPTTDVSTNRTFDAEAPCDASSSDMKIALRMYIMHPKDRFGENARSLRNLLRHLCKYSSEPNISIIEGQWRACITDLVYEICTEQNRLTAAPKPRQSRHSAAEVNVHAVEKSSHALVNILIRTLMEMRNISRIDMSMTKQCSMSADLAFLASFQRLPKETSIEVTKALAVRISALVDSFKQYSNQRTWYKAIEDVTDLIQVFFTQTSAEFQHFYELLLARRLLRSRYITLSIERRVLTMLPAMSKSGVMLNDIERTIGMMDSFRSHLINRIDFMDLKLPRGPISYRLSPIAETNKDENYGSDESEFHNVTELSLIKGRLTINILTANVWPSIWLSPTAFATLRLPSGLDIIKNEFIHFFDTMGTAQYDAWNLNDKHKIYQVHGSEENKNRINGIYEPTTEISDGWPIFEMRGNNTSILEYSGRTNSWQIKKRADKGKNAGWAYCKTSSRGSGPDTLDRPWFVWKKGLRKWIVQPIKVTCISHNVLYGDDTNPAQTFYSSEPPNDTPTALNTRLQLDREVRRKPRSLRKLIWCSSAGTLTIDVRDDVGQQFSILATEPQAALLLAFNSMLYYSGSNLMSRSPSLSIRELREMLNIQSDEMRQLLVTLATTTTHLLDISSDADDHEHPYNESLRSDVISASLLSTQSRNASFGEITTSPETPIEARSRRHSKAGEGDKRIAPIQTKSSGIPVAFYLDTTQFVLSKALRDGLLGRKFASKTFILPQIETQSDAHLLASDLHSTYGWRNELIDACIVRVLKDACLNKTGEFPDAQLQRYASLSVDTLSYRVRQAMKHQCEVSENDIIQRSERLVSIGVIEKLTGNSESFRSIAYAYLAYNYDDATGVSGSNSGANTNVGKELGKYAIERVTGRDLFNHMKIVLGISHQLPYSVPGISFSLFRSKFISWILGSVVEVDNSQRFHVLDLLMRALATITSSIPSQLNALLLQQWAGRDDSTTDDLTIEAATVEPPLGMSSLNYCFDDTTATGHQLDCDPDGRLFYQFGWLHRILLEHLPDVLLENILNYYRSLLHEAPKDYSHSIKLPHAVSDSLKASKEELELNVVDPADDHDQQQPSHTGSGTVRHHNSIFPSTIIESISRSISAFGDDIYGMEQFLSNRNATVQQDVQLMWNRTVMVHKDTLMHKFGFRDDTLAALNINEKRSTKSSHQTETSISRFAPRITNNGKDLNSSMREKDSDGFVMPRHLPPGDSYRLYGNCDKGTNTGMVHLTFEKLVAAIMISACRDVSLTFSVKNSIIEKPAEAKNSSAKYYCTVGKLLEEYFFKEVVDTIAEMFGTDLNYESDDREVIEDGAERDATELQQDHEPEEQEVMIPCEFCTDSIRVSRFEAHVMACRAGRPLPEQQEMEVHAVVRAAQAAAVNALARTGGAEEFIRHHQQLRQTVDTRATIAHAASNTVNTILNDRRASLTTLLEEQNAVERKQSSMPRPSCSSPVAISLVECLLNCLSSTAASVRVRTVATEREFPICKSSPINENIQVDDDRKNEVEDPSPFTNFVRDVFSKLDLDRDSFLTLSDFATKELRYEDLQMEVDPVQVYKRVNHFMSSQTTPVHMKTTPLVRHGNLDATVGNEMSKITFAVPNPQQQSPSSRANEKESTEDLVALSTPIPLMKSDSLWRSVSHEKSLPKADATRSYSRLEEADLELSTLIDRAKVIIDDSEATSLALLVHYKWDLKVLVEEYIENSRAVRFEVGLGPRTLPPFLRFDLFGIASSTHANDSKTIDKNLTDSNVVMCGICQDSVAMDEAYALHCRHWFCADCWQGYIHSNIGDRKVVYYCPQPDCRMLITSDMQSFFCEKEQLVEAKNVLLKSFVEERRGKRVLATYCKNPRGCSGIVLMADDAHYSDASCSLCGTAFCAACDLPPHAPATCELIAKWEEQGGYIETGKEEDAEARKLKHLTTKPCPKCGVRIEKNGGCPHMTCTQPTCKYQFCWECAGEYHTSSTCTRPKIKTDSNNILAFDEYDRQCANHFLARRVALKGRADSLKLLEQAQRQEEATVARVISEGWSILAEAQSALAHTCIVMLNVRSAKLQFCFESQKATVQSLQQKFEEVWTPESFPLVIAKAAIRDIRNRLHDFLLIVRSEIIRECSPTDKKTSARLRHELNARFARGFSYSGAQQTERSAINGGDNITAVSNFCLPIGSKWFEDSSKAEQSIDNSDPNRKEQTPSNAQWTHAINVVFGDAFAGSHHSYRPMSVNSCLDRHIKNEEKAFKDIGTEAADILDDTVPPQEKRSGSQLLTVTHTDRDTINMLPPERRKRRNQAGDGEAFSSTDRTVEFTFTPDINQQRPEEEVGFESLLQNYGIRSEPDGHRRESQQLLGGNMDENSMNNLDSSLLRFQQLDAYHAAIRLQQFVQQQVQQQRDYYVEGSALSGENFGMEDFFMGTGGAADDDFHDRNIFQTVFDDAVAHQSSVTPHEGIDFEDEVDEEEEDYEAHEH